MTATKQPRDVLADRIEQWAGDDWRIYDWADHLIADLDKAGFQILGKGTVGDDATAPDYEEAGGHPHVASWIRELLAGYREYDAAHRWVDLTGTAREVRFYDPDNVVNALAPHIAAALPNNTPEARR